MRKIVVNVLASTILALAGFLLVRATGGPDWAQVATFYIVYMVVVPTR